MYTKDGDENPLFPPQYDAALGEDLAAVLEKSPREYDLNHSRWRLVDFIGYLPGVGCRSAVWRVLHRLGFRYRRGWSHQVSPDPWAQEKLQWIAAVQARACQSPQDMVVLWLDELTFYRLPTPSYSWYAGDRRAQKAHLTGGHNTVARIVGVVNALSGQFDYWLRSKVGEPELRRFYGYLRQRYPQAKEIYVIQDCWPVHFLPSVCARANQQGITLVALPTYASWRNPIEKVWRWLKQAVIHMHPWADDWHRLKQEVQHFLDRFLMPNAALLRYIGLPN
jgi:DDE superfamily endonuclease